MDDDCLLFIFIFYFSHPTYTFFYRHERKLYYETCIKKMIEEIRYMQMETSIIKFLS